MSTTIDERVLEMRFDNRQFENNVSTTMSTLDKLKQKLNFTGASKGLENVNAAAKNVNMTGLGSAVETVSAKFSALQVMGVTALANITNSAVNAGKRIVSALTIDPIKTGLSEYETKINAIQVIKANTRGKNTMDDITAALEDLNAYADRTIYNFAQMTDNVGKFVAQGLDVHQAAKAVEGIANLAGASGASAQDMARATYQMSQSLGGVIRKIDWNSLRNANMATVELKNTLMDIARVRNINIDDMIKEKGTFEETLEKGWLTGEIFTEAMNIYSDVYSEAELKAKGFTDDQITNFKELAQLAREATTEVKTFSQLCDVLKETAQSGWTQTWELIFGDFETSKAMFTDLQVYFSDIINGWSEARNTLLKNVLQPSEAIESIFGKLGKLGDIPALEKITKIGDNITNVTDKLKKFQDITRQVWRGDYGNGSERRTLLEEAGYNADVVQELVNKGNRYKLTVEDIEAAHEKYGVTLSKSADMAKASAGGFEGAADAISDLSDERLKDAGLTEDEIALYKQLQKESKRTGRSFVELAKAMSQRSGRDLLIDSIKNAWAGLVNILTAVKDAWYDVFEPLSAVRLYTIIESIEKFTQRLRDNGNVAESVGKIFRGLFAALDIVITVLSGPFKFLTKIVSSVLKALGTSFLEVTAKVGDGIVALRNGIDDVIGTLSKFIADHISKWIEKVRELEVFKTIGEWFNEAKESISDSIDSISKKFAEFDTSGFMNGARAFSGFISTIASNLANSDIFVFIVGSICSAFEKLKDFFTSFKLPDLSLDNLRIFSGLATALEGANGIGGAFTALGTWIKDRTVLKAKNAINGIFDVAYWDNFKAMAVEKFVSFWTTTGDKVKAAFAKCKEVLKTIGEFLFGTEEINLPVILDVAQKFLGLVVLIKTIRLLNTLSSPLDNVTDAIDNLAKKLKWEAIGAAFKSMALALGTLTVCIVVLANMPDPGSAAKAAGILAGLLVVMGGIIAGLMALSTKFKTKDALDIVSVALSLGLLIGAIYLLTLTLEKIDSMHLVDPFETFVALGAMLAGLAAGIGIVALAGSSSFKSVAAILTLVAALNMMLDVIDKYDTHDWAGQGDAVLRMAGILLVLSTAINIASRGVKTTAGAAGLATLLLAMVFSLKILLDVMEDFAAMDTGAMVKGGLAVVALLGTMAWMMIEIGNANQGKVLEKGQKSVNNFVGLATALLAVVAAVWLLGKMATKDTDTFISGALAVTAILTGFTFMISKIGKSCAGLKMGVVVAALIGMGLIIAEVAIILKALEGIPWQQSLGTAAALGVVLLSMAGCLKVISKLSVDSHGVTTWMLALSALTVLVMFLAVILQSMETVTAMNAVGNATALGILLLAMAGCLKILNSGTVDAKQIYTWVGVLATMSVVMLLLSTVLAIINTIEPGRALPNVVALVLLLSGMAAVLGVLSMVPVQFKSIMTWVAALGGLAIVVGILGHILQVMDGMDSTAALENAKALANLAVALSIAVIPLAAVSKISSDIGPGIFSLIALSVVLGLLVAGLSCIKNVDVARENAITLANLAVVLSLCAIPLAAASMMAPAATAGVQLLVALAVILGLLVAALSFITNVETARENAITLSNLAIVLSLCTIPLALACVLAPAATVGAGLLVALAVVLGLLVAGLSFIKNIETARANVLTIIVLVGSLTNMIMLIGSLGVNSLFAVAAINGIISLVGTIGVMVAAMGALSDLMDGKLESFTDKGLDLLKKLARGIGEMVSEFGIGVSSGLPEIATNLSKFAFNLIPFIVTMNMIRDDIVDRATNLAGAIIGLGIAELISSFVPGELSSLGKELSDFASNMGGFAIAMTAFKPETVTAVESLCSAINALSEANLTTVFADFFDGLLNGGSGNSLGDFGTQMSTFATCIKDAAKALKDITQDDVDHITLAADAGKAMATLNGAIPGSGGYWQEWAGEKNLATWGETLTAFGDCLIAFNEKVTGKDFDADAITASANAAKALADVNTSIPGSGGYWQEWSGEKNLATWGETLVAFGQCLVDYNGKVTGKDFDTDAITNSATAASALTEVANALPESDGKWQQWAGEKNLGTFGQQLAAFADGLVAYCTAASGIDQAALDSIEFSKQAVTKLLEVVALLPTEGGWWNSIAGSSGGQSFGDSIKSLAVGIASYCGTAKTIDEAALTAIDNSKKAVTKLKAIIEEEVPGVGNSTNVEYLRLAVEDFSSIAATIGALTAAAYDYSGIDGLETAISKVVGMVGEDGIDASSVESNFLSLWDGISIVIQCATDLVGLNAYTYTGISTFKAAIESLKTISLDGIAGAFSGSGDIVSMMTSVVDSMASGISDNAGKVTRAMGLLASDAISALEEYIDDFKDVSTDYVLKFASNMKNLKSNAKTAGIEIGAEAVAGASSKVVAMTTAGKDLGAGLVVGIDAKWLAVYNAGYRLGQAAVLGEKAGQASNSPSKLTIQAGKWLGEGLVIGMERMGKSVYNAGADLGRTATSTVSGTISKIADAINTDIDSQPTIRPVLDLSDVRAGAAGIGELFDTTSQVGVMANLGTVGTMMSRYRQNGGNDDVISAIDRLRKDLGNVRGDSYLINGVTYDDGSNIADAVRTIARAAIMERRM